MEAGKAVRTGCCSRPDKSPRWSDQTMDTERTEWLQDMLRNGTDGWNVGMREKEVR